MSSPRRWWGARGLHGPERHPDYTRSRPPPWRSTVGLPRPPTPTHLLGVDQTGASRARGRRAAPLPLALLTRRPDGPWVLDAGTPGHPRTLPGLTPDAVAEHAPLAPTTALLVDAVVGLVDGPAGADGWWTLVERAATFTHEGRRFGRAVGAAFFGPLAPDDPTRHARRADRVSGALPVFRHTPFQRNVQTGTHRVWRDLGQAPQRWVQPWPLQRPDDPDPAGPWLFEAWPTWGWRHLLDLRTRQPEALPDRLAARFPHLTLVPGTAEVLAQRPDHADAAVAALVGHVHLTEPRKPLAPGLPDADWVHREGWILGLPWDADAAAPDQGST